MTEGDGRAAGRRSEPAAGEPDAARRLREVAGLFLRLGATAFGGPAAHIAAMDDEVVSRRRWLTRGEFADLLGAAHLIPGPNSTELAIHVGYRRAGVAGLALAGVCFIVPAFAIVSVIAEAYVRYGRLPAATGLLYGTKPVVVAIIAVAVWRLGRTTLRRPAAAAVAAASLLLALADVPEVAVLLAGGAVAAGRKLLRDRGDASTASAAILLPTGLAPARGGAGASAALAASLGSGAVAFGLAPLFLYFLFVGSVLYGSGYVLIALLEGTLVDSWGWLTASQLADAIAVGQVTPGPVFTTATFIGYVLGGLPGAVVATVGIFLPSFVFVWATAPWIGRLRGAPVPAAFLDGVNAAAVSLIALVAVRLAGEALVDPLAWALAIGGGAAMVGRGVGAPVVLLVGGLVGLAAHALG